MLHPSPTPRPRIQAPDLRVEGSELSLNSGFVRLQAQLLSHTRVSSLQFELTCVKVACLFQNKLFLKIQTSLYTINPIFKISIGFSFDIYYYFVRDYTKKKKQQNTLLHRFTLPVVHRPSISIGLHTGLVSEKPVCVCVCVKVDWKGETHRTWLGKHVKNTTTHLTEDETRHLKLQYFELWPHDLRRHCWHCTKMKEENVEMSIRGHKLKIATL